MIMRTKAKRGFQVTPVTTAIVAVVAITLVVIATGPVWRADDTAPAHESPVATAPGANSGGKNARTPATAETKAAMLDADTLRQRVAGAWLATGKPDRASELSSTLDHHLADTRQLLTRLVLQRESASGQSSRHILQQIASKQAEFLTLREEAERWLADHDMQGSDRALQITQRFEQVKSVLAAVINTTGNTPRDAPHDAPHDTQTQAIAAAQQTLQRLHPPRIGMRGEPQPTVTQGEPTQLTPDDFPNAPPPAYAAPSAPSAAIKQSTTAPIAGTRVDSFANRFGEELFGVLSRSVGISTAHADVLPATPAEAASCGYVTADVASALPEVDVTNLEIQALAEQLQHSPLKIYAWIKNNIEFQPYFGSLKGALATLKSGSGNATDQASR